MGADQHVNWLDAAASTLDWWAEAGVDTLVDDTPRDWFTRESDTPAIAPVPAAVTSPGGTARGGAAAPAIDSALPDTIEAFAAWRISAAAPEADWRGDFLNASGAIDAAIAVIVDCPDADDASAGRLLSGAAGVLFDRMLAAIGLTRDTIYLAPVCAKRPLAGRMPRDVEARLGDVARHHLGFATPKRILCLGNAASRAITGTDMPANRGRLHSFNHKSGDIGVVTSFHPRLLLERPALKAEAWKDLQLLIGDLS